ncbi:hypothetical protein J6590_090958 [Homalodisca vitripennis]|nr:hypothetical protein J6590_090958 [Homalodisca vitripennis]
MKDDVPQRLASRSQDLRAQFVCLRGKVVRRLENFYVELRLLDLSENFPQHHLSIYVVNKKPFGNLNAAIQNLAERVREVDFPAHIFIISPWQMSEDDWRNM